jgi:adenosine/AMP kinase
MMVTTEVNLPVVIGAEDYHEFEDLLRAIKKVIPKIKFREIGFCNSEKEYQAVFYVGNLRNIPKDMMKIHEGEPGNYLEVDDG